MGGGSWGIPQARGIGLALVDPAELFSEGVVPVWPTARYSLLCNNSKSVLNPTTEWNKGFIPYFINEETDSRGV